MRQPTVWTEEGLEAFKKLQVSMGRYQLLSFLKTDMIDKESIVTLRTDASLHGMSGVLLQIIKGKEYVMGLVSKSFDATQQRWTTIKQELYAAVYCMIK